MWSLLNEAAYGKDEQKAQLESIMAAATVRELLDDASGTAPAGWRPVEDDVEALPEALQGMPAPSWFRDGWVAGAMGGDAHAALPPEARPGYDGAFVDEPAAEVAADAFPAMEGFPQMGW